MRSSRHPRVELASAASLPTEFGNFRIQVFTSDRDDREQVAIVHGEVFGAESVPTRLQEEGLDTVDANLALGFRDDERDYGVAVGMLRTLGVRSVRLMTNNPDNVAQLGRYGLQVTERLAHAIPPGVHNRGYLETKARRSGHILDLAADAPQRREPREPVGPA